MESNSIELLSNKKVKVTNNIKLCNQKHDSKNLGYQKPTHANNPDEIKSNFQCQICTNFEAATRAALLLHIVQCHNTSMLKSEHIDLDNLVVNFENQNIAKQQRNITRKVFECDVCNMKFSNGANMRRHKMRHTGVKPYECRICQKRFFRKDHLAEHFTTHTKTLPYHCPICNRGFQRQIAMRAHFQNEHVGQHDLVKTCPLCTYRAGSMKSLRIHFFNRHGIDLDTKGSNETSSLILDFETQILNPIAASNTIFKPHAVSSLKSTTLTEHDDIKDITFKDSATPPMHFLTPHVEISLPANDDTLNESIEANSSYILTENFSDEKEIEIPLPRTPSNAIAETRSSPLYQPEQVHQAEIFDQSTKDSKNSTLNLTTQFSPVLSPHITEVNKNTPSISLLPIKQEYSIDEFSFQTARDPDKKTKHGCERISEPICNEIDSLIKVSPLKSLLRDDLKRRLYARTNHKTETSVLLKKKNMFNTETANVLSNGTITSNKQSAFTALTRQKILLTCLFCGIEFPDETLYFLHKGCHTENNPWKCNICGEQCNDVYEFNSHLLSKSHQ